MSHETRTIYYTGVDGGDGSISVEFFESQECIDLLEEAIPEYYRGEGGNSFTVTGETDLEVTTLEEVKEQIAEWNGDE
jgi:hypothetical protein